MCMMLSEKGFSLIEVLVSLTILSVSVIGITQFFHQANQISAGNNTKLVATNLARMTLERVQTNPESFGFTLTPGTYSSTICKTQACLDLYKVQINNKRYTISIKISQSTDEKNIGIFSTNISVDYGKPKLSTVEGYIKDAKSTN